jgi:hypothetical protein
VWRLIKSRLDALLLLLLGLRLGGLLFTFCAGNEGGRDRRDRDRTDPSDSPND